MEEKTETVKCYSTLKEPENIGSDKPILKASPNKVVTEGTTEYHI